MFIVKIQLKTETRSVASLKRTLIVFSGERYFTWIAKIQRFVVIDPMNRFASQATPRKLIFIAKRFAANGITGCQSAFMERNAQQKLSYFEGEFFLLQTY